MQTILALYFPIVIALVAVIFAFRFSPSERLILKLPLPFVDWDLPVTNKLLQRFVLVGLALALVSWTIFRDYSPFFPTKMTLRVFYDTDGIDRSVRELPSVWRTNLKIKDYSATASQDYRHKLDATLGKVLKKDLFFSTPDGVVYSEGAVEFVVAKQGGGFQCYHIAKSSGELMHSLERPGLQPTQFRSSFSLLPSEGDEIEPSIGDILLRGGAVINPQFRQVLWANASSDAVLFDHTLVGVSRVCLFPYPVCRKTLYCLVASDGSLTPVAYAVYSN